MLSWTAENGLVRETPEFITEESANLALSPSLG
jgi:hypothetical protein